MVFSSKNFNLKDGILDFYIKDNVTLKVGKFYEESPFPNYKINDSKHTILEIGDNNLIMRELKKFVLDVTTV